MKATQTMEYVADALSIFVEYGIHRTGDTCCRAFAVCIVTSSASPLIIRPTIPFPLPQPPLFLRAPVMPGGQHLQLRAQPSGHPPPLDLGTAAHPAHGQNR